jgi:hypothetical protein
MKKNKGKQIILYLIMLFFLLIKIFHLINQKGMTWDSAVYIGMGRYIFSLGKIGLWESSRALVWPVFLGFLWRIGLNPVVFGKILELMFGLGCIYLVYLIGKDIFNEKIALLSAFFLAFSPTFLFYSSNMLTGIVSTFFSLLGIYFLIGNKYFLAGLFVSLGFMTRFLQLFVLIVIIFMLFLYKKNKLKNIINLSYGFLIILIPYLILNIFLYKNPIYPLLLQVFMSKYTGWIFNQPLSFYFINLFKENFLILFAIIGTIIILKQKDYKKSIILGIFLLFFVFFNLIAHKEMRFILVFLPYMCLTMSYGIFKSLKLVKKRKKLFNLVVIIVGIVLLVQISSQIKVPMYKEYGKFMDYVEKDDVKEGIWISNPIFIVNSNKKADELIYYPLYNSKRIDVLKGKLLKTNHILIDTCDILPCPAADKNCYGETGNFLDLIEEDFEAFYYKKEDSCEQFIFRR